MIQQFTSFAKSLISWLFATLVVCAVLVGFFYFQRADEELRRIVEHKLSEQFPGQTISVNSAKFVQGEGVRLRGVSLVQPAEGALPRNEVLFCKEAELNCSPSIEELLQGKIEIYHIRLRDCVLRVSRQTSGTWSWEGMLPPCDPTRPMPSVSIEGGEVQFADHVTGHELTVHDIHAEVTPPAKSSQQQHVVVRCSFSNQHFKQASLQGWVDRESGRWSVDGQVSECHLSPEWLQYLPAAPAALANIDFRADVDVNFQARQLDLTAPPQVSAQAQLYDGRIEGIRHLQPITDLNIQTLEFNHAQWVVGDLKARMGSAQVHVTRAHGTTSNPADNFQAAGTVKQLQLTDQLKRVLSPRLQETWNKYNPTGLVDAGFLVGRMGGEWQFECNAEARDVSLLSSFFPYPLVRTRGPIYFKRGQRLTAKLTAATERMTQESPIAIEVDVYRPGPDFQGTIDVTGSWLPLDRKLKNALAPAVQTILTDLNARGEVGFRAKFWANETTQGRLHKDIIVDFRNGNVKYHSFPYPLRQVGGRIHIEEDIWRISGFAGQNDSCVVRCDGSWIPLSTPPPAGRRVPVDQEGGTPSRFAVSQLRSSNRVPIRSVAAKPAAGLYAAARPAQTNYRTQPTQMAQTPAPPTQGAQTAEGGELRLTFNASDIPCDVELKDSLPPAPRSIWEDLRPRGNIDHATIKLYHRTGLAKPELDIVVTQLQRADDPDRRSLEIQPNWFPLRMSRVTGTFDYRRDGTFSLRNLHAQHGPPRRAAGLQAQGKGVFRDDGTWTIDLTKILAEGIQTTPELTAALPASLSSAMKTMDFQAKLSVYGDMAFHSSSHPQAPIDSAWQTTVIVDNGSLVLGGHPVQNIFGKVKVSGRSEGEQWWTGGQTDISSLMCKGVQVTNLSSPWLMVPDRMIFGSAATADEASSRFLTAELFGGTVHADGVVLFESHTPFQIKMGLRDFDLAKAARDLAVQSNVSGRGEATLQLTGNAEGTHSLDGSGQIQLRDANLAKLPSIITLINEMQRRNTAPDVFTSSDISYVIDGPDIYLNRFDLHGESLSLKGEGAISLDKRLNLAFYTILGGENGIWPVARAWVGQTSQQFLRIEVTGTLDDQNWSRKVLPGWPRLMQDSNTPPPATKRVPRAAGKSRSPWFR